MPFFEYGPHTIEVKIGPDGEETVSYDGLMVSHKKPYAFADAHKFSAKEEGEEAHYEVLIRSTGGLLGAVPRIAKTVAPKVEVLRNGKKISKVK